jgi:hypothetical protein
MLGNYLPGIFYCLVFFLAQSLYLALANYQFSMKNFLCCKCGNQVIKSSMPHNGDCERGGVHQWVNLGLQGSTAFSCIKCKMKVNSKNTPDGSGCLKGGLHQWKKS